MVCEASEPGESTAASFEPIELAPSEARLECFAGVVVGALFLPLSSLGPKLMMISGAIGLEPSRVEGRTPVLDGRRCCTTYVPVPVGVRGLIGEGVSSREWGPFLVWYSEVFLFTLEHKFPPRDLSQG